MVVHNLTNVRRCVERMASLFAIWEVSDGRGFGRFVNTDGSYMEGTFLNGQMISIGKDLPAGRPKLQGPSRGVL